MSRKAPNDCPYTREEAKAFREKIGVPPAPPKDRKVCPFCGGLGYLRADVGQVFECVPCKTTGRM